MDTASSHGHLVEVAWQLARATHDGQLDKVGEPYIHHVERVVDRVRRFAPADLTGRCELVAILHDVVEDGPYELADLCGLGFTDDVVAGVDAVTRRAGPPEEPYESLIERSAADELGRWVKLADNLDNADPSRLVRMERSAAERLRERYGSARDVLVASILDAGHPDPLGVADRRSPQG